jgi:hypothetical protein
MCIKNHMDNPLLVASAVNVLNRTVEYSEDKLGAMVKSASECIVRHGGIRVLLLAMEEFGSIRTGNNLVCRLQNMVLHPQCFDGCST